MKSKFLNIKKFSTVKDKKDSIARKKTLQQLSRMEKLLLPWKPEVKFICQTYSLMFTMKAKPIFDVERVPLFLQLHPIIININHTRGWIF